MCVCVRVFLFYEDDKERDVWVDLKKIGTMHSVRGSIHLKFKWSGRVGGATSHGDGETDALLGSDAAAMSSDFMTEHLLMIEKPPTPGFYEVPPSAEAKRASQAAWHGIRHERMGLESGERPDRLELCRRAIVSGRFHAIILSDLSGDTAVPAVEAELGPALQAFVRGGGAIAVTTCDSAMVLQSLKRLFGVCWKQVYVLPSH